jgi:hypothetical protein
LNISKRAGAISSIASEIRREIDFAKSEFSLEKQTYLECAKSWLDDKLPRQLLVSTSRQRQRLLVGRSPEEREFYLSVAMDYADDAARFLVLLDQAIPLQFSVAVAPADLAGQVADFLLDIEGGALKRQGVMGV